MKPLMYKIETDQAPKAIGPYSQAVGFGNLLFISGQIPIDPQTNQMVTADIKIQTKRVIDNIEAILKKAGLCLDHVIKCEVFLKNMQDFKEMNTIYSERFTADIKPARQAFEVAKLPLDALIEISCIAANNH